MEKEDIERAIRISLREQGEKATQKWEEEFKQKNPSKYKESKFLMCEFIEFETAVSMQERKSRIAPLRRSSHFLLDDEEYDACVPYTTIPFDVSKKLCEAGAHNERKTWSQTHEGYSEYINATAKMFAYVQERH